VQAPDGTDVTDRAMLDNNTLAITDDEIAVVMMTLRLNCLLGGNKCNTETVKRIKRYLEVVFNSVTKSFLSIQFKLLSLSGILG